MRNYPVLLFILLNAPADARSPPASDSLKIAHEISAEVRREWRAVDQNIGKVIYERKRVENIFSRSCRNKLLSPNDEGYRRQLEVEKKTSLEPIRKAAEAYRSDAEMILAKAERYRLKVESSYVSKPRGEDYDREMARYLSMVEEWRREYNDLVFPRLRTYYAGIRIYNNAYIRYPESCSANPILIGLREICHLVECKKSIAGV